MKNRPTQRKVKKIKVWWLRKGGEGFLTSNLWMNGNNARLQAKGLHLKDTGSHTGKPTYKVIPCTLTYFYSPSKKK